MVRRWEKLGQSWKAPPGGRAEIKNGVWCDFHIFNFNSANRGHFSNVNALFYIYGPFAKKEALRFLKERILVEILNKMYKRGPFWALFISSILKWIVYFITHWYVMSYVTGPNTSRECHTVIFRYSTHILIWLWMLRLFSLLFRILIRPQVAHRT